MTVRTLKERALERMTRKEASKGRFSWSVTRIIAMLAPFLLIAALAEAGSPWDPDDVTLTARELAPGVFVVLPHDAFEKDHVATAAGFVIGEKGVLVIESMVNGQLASQLIGLVRKVTSRSIRYLVNTSYHGDHSYGNFVFPETTTIIHHKATKRYIDEKFEDDRAFMLRLMGRHKGIEEVVPRSADLVVRDRLSVDLGGKMVEILHFGFAQTPGDLVVWLPVEKVLWVGNMIQAPEPALPWLLEGRHQETIITLKKVRDFLPEDATIIPGHGRPMRRDGINFSIRYLEELSRRVREAIANGLSVKEAVRQIRMPQYETYSLYDFAHKTVNIPAIYKDLAGK